MPEDTPPPPLKKIFPKNFLWGASTAAHQVEGNTHNQWSVWQYTHAQRLAKTAQKRLGALPNWEKIAPQAQSRENYISGRGVEHYTRYKDDFKLARKLNMNAFRFGIEWSRIEPEEGKWDEEAIKHYQQYIREMTEKGLEPMLNIWHWTMPVWFARKGGFEKRANLKYWSRFVHKVATELTHDLTYVITINEPNVYATFSYQMGEWPPQQKNLLKMTWVYWNLVKAHKQAFYLLKHQDPRLQIGIAAQLANIQAKRAHNIVDELSTKLMRYLWNWWFLRRIRKEQDFVGFNYYFTDYYTGRVRRENPRVPLNDLGWYMEPEGLYPLLLRIWAHYKKPIIITENGVADSQDQYRRWWLEETIIAMERAISEGVDIKGYFHWSLLDNFEWATGWWPKFGLIEVDRKTMKRTIRPSAYWFAKQIKKLS